MLLSIHFKYDTLGVKVLNHINSLLTGGYDRNCYLVFTFCVRQLETPLDSEGAEVTQRLQLKLRVVSLSEFDTGLF